MRNKIVLFFILFSGMIFSQTSRFIYQLDIKLNDEIETFFMVADGEYSFLSSSIVKEIASFGGDFERLVPENVSKKLLLKYGRI